MNITNFKNIVGEVKSGEIASIRFFGKITEESVNQFNSEFDFLENVIKPSLIRVLINSEGGSVLHGMTAYSTIQNSGITTECIVEGMAASMASVIWAAGNKSLMWDYSILMIHNPFLPSDCDDDKSSDLVQAFTKQITTIYRKRFGLKKEHVESIMSGEAGKDGTFFDSHSAVKAGIIPTDNILHTSKQLCDRVKNEISKLESVSEIQQVMALISDEAQVLKTENKPLSPQIPNLKKTDNQNPMTETKKQSPEYAAVAASLGLKENFEVKDVMARISELIGVEAKLGETTKALSDAQTVIAGRDATIQNLQKDNDELTTSLKSYRDKEEEEKKTRINDLVEAAINDGRIDKVTKDQWTQMAEANFSLAESTLNSIPVPEQISKEISSDPTNVQAAMKSTKTAEEELAEKVNAVVGKEFEFKKLK